MEAPRELLQPTPIEIMWGKTTKNPHMHKQHMVQRVREASNAWHRPHTPSSKFFSTPCRATIATNRRQESPAVNRLPPADGEAEMDPPTTSHTPADPSVFTPEQEVWLEQLLATRLSAIQTSQHRDNKYCSWVHISSSHRKPCKVTRVNQEG